MEDVYCLSVWAFLRKPYLLVPTAFLIVLAAWQYGHEVWYGHPGDLVHRWVGSRELLLYGRDPYGELVTEKIQIALTGHKYDPRRDSLEQRFYYPVYVVFLMAPTLRLPFPLVRKIFALALLLLTAMSVPLWLDFIDWHVSRKAQFALVVLTACSMAALQGIYLQNLGLLVSALTAGACWAIRRSRFVLAGPLFAFATIKPQLVAPLILCILLWSTGAWSERRTLLWSFLLSMVVLVTAGELVLPGWVRECVRGILIYPEKTYGISPLQFAFARPLGFVLTAAMIFSLLYLAWRMRRIASSVPQFALFVALCLAITLAVVPSLVPYSDLQLLPGVLFLVRWRKPLFLARRWPRYLYFTTVGLVIWPYVSMVLLLATRLAHLTLIPNSWEMPLATMPMLPLFVVAALAYAVLVGLDVRPTVRPRAAVPT